MRTDKTTIITSELLNSLEKTCDIKELVTEQEFIDVLKLDNAIIYMLVDWSGPEKISRYLVYQVLTDLGPEEGTPVLSII